MLAQATYQVISSVVQRVLRSLDLPFMAFADGGFKVLPRFKNMENFHGRVDCKLHLLLLGSRCFRCRVIAHATALHSFLFCRVCRQLYGLVSKAESLRSRSQRPQVQVSSDYAASVSRAGYEVLAQYYVSNKDSRGVGEASWRIFGGPLVDVSWIRLQDELVGGIRKHLAGVCSIKLGPAKQSMSSSRRQNIFHVSLWWATFVLF